jgi:ribose transport system substrate-binding protein
VVTGTGALTATVAVTGTAAVTSTGYLSGTAGSQALLAALPPALRSLYDHSPDALMPSAYDGYQPAARPWLICSAASYQGNPWRAAVENELKVLVRQFQAAGLASGFQQAASGGSVTLQAQQLRQFADKGCSVILTITESPTGLNDAIAYAYGKGVPVVTMAGPVTSPYAINVDSNHWRWGYDMMDGIGQRLKGTGNVLMVEGTAGDPVAVAEDQGAAAAMANYPGLQVIARVNGNWTASATRAAVQQALAAHRGTIGAVWTTGSDARVVAAAFRQAARPQPWITGSLAGDALGYWKLYPQGFKFFGGALLPGPTGQAGLRVAVRLLEGQHPRLNVLMIPLPSASLETLDQWYQGCMTPASTSIFPVPPADPMPEELMNGYFTNGAATPPYDYGKTPRPCAG